MLCYAVLCFIAQVIFDLSNVAFIFHVFFSSLYLFLFASQFVDSLYRWCTLFVVVIVVVVVVVVAGVVVVQYVSNANLNLIEKGD